VKYVRIVSWHVVRIDRSRGGFIRTRCGRYVPEGQIEEQLPLGEKSCETCLRLAATDG
jgi:hypothetical protein